MGERGCDSDLSLRHGAVVSPEDWRGDALAPPGSTLYRRAQALAENSRAKVGALVSAEQGVLQITRRHSTDTSGYGMYDTSTIEKTVKAVVTLEYRIDTT